MGKRPSSSRRPKQRPTPPTGKTRPSARGPSNRRPGQEILAAYHRRQSDEWATPRDRFEEWNAEFGPFTLDAAATADNALCRRFYTAEDDALTKPWRGRVWCNPPYSRVGEFVAKASEEVEAGRADIVGLLVPSRTDTRWWHDYVEGKAEVRFLRGRLKFSGSNNSAPFPSALVIFRRTGTP